jgi:hypothetical protein
MANEIVYSGLGDQRLAAILAQEIELLLADRQSLWGHPSLVYLGDLAGRGSAAIQQPQVGLDGYDEMAAVVEGSSTSNTALADASDTVTIARQALQYQYSGLAELTEPSGIVDPVRLARSMVGSALVRFQSMITALHASFSQSVGTSGVDMSVDDFFDANITLDLVSAPADRVMDLHPRQWGDLQQSLRAELGAIGYSPATAEMLAAWGPGVKGMFLGNLIFASSKVATANAGADRDGACWARGAILWADATGRPRYGSFGTIIPAGKIQVEFESDAAGNLTKVVGNYFVGVAEGQDTMAVRVVTDA